MKAGAAYRSAWGIFDRDNKPDVYGTLNFASPEVVVAARAEIRTGESVVLNLPLHLPYKPPTGRAPLKHKITSDCHGWPCAEDEISIYMQASSQWLGMYHWADRNTKMYYNGVSYESVTSGKERKNNSLGIQCLSDRGGIIGRGVLLDFVRYAKRKGITYSVMKNYGIGVEQLKEMIKEQGVTLRPGDILLVRCGMSKWIHESTPDSEAPSPDKEGILGIEPSEDLYEWIWNNKLAAVGSDTIAFECLPAADGSWLSLHDVLLVGWGMPIGELLDLEAVAKMAEEYKRWTFFLTICPLNVNGAGATVSNTLAIF